MRKTQLYKILFLICFWVACVIFIVFYDASILGFKSEIKGENYNFLRLLISSVINCIIGASLLGSIEVLYLNRLLRKKSLGASLLIKTIIYLVFMTFFISLGTIYNYAAEINKPIFSDEVLNHYLNFLFSARILMPICYWGIACMLALFVLQVSDKFGQGVLPNFILGKYHTPKEEDRIIMCLDLNDATAIAEKLEPLKYSYFIKEFFFDLDDAIYETKGAVFQFVGDEVVIIWTLKKGIENNNCIRFFFLVEDKIQNSKNKYLENYGVCPEFKAGIHYGKIIITEVGASKSEIAYHGDTINTAARIRSVCHKYHKRFLLSADLLSYIQDIDKDFIVESVGLSQLKGKEKVLELFGVEEKV